MMAGGLFIGGLWLLYLAGRSTFTAEEKRFLAGLGGKVAAAFGIVYLAAGLWADQRAAGCGQADGLARPPAGYPFYKYFGLAGYGWLALVGWPFWLPRSPDSASSHGALGQFGRRACLPC